MSSGIDGAFNESAIVSEKEETGLGREVGKYVELTIKDNGAYNTNVLAIVDSTIKDCIKYSVLAEFYSVCLNADLQRLSQSKQVDKMLQLRQRLFQLKKRNISSLY
jgi:hypothetical protein